VHIILFRFLVNLLSHDPRSLGIRKALKLAERLAQVEKSLTELQIQVRGATGPARDRLLCELQRIDSVAVEVSETFSKDDISKDPVEESAFMRLIADELLAEPYSTGVDTAGKFARASRDVTLSVDGFSCASVDVDVVQAAFASLDSSLCQALCLSESIHLRGDRSHAYGCPLDI
jgi:hypothetical protein